MTSSDTSNAVVISSTRRFVSLLNDHEEIIQATSSSKALQLSVGDRVHYEFKDSDNVVTSISKPKNQLIRSYRKEKRVMASNLDHIFAVTAVGPSFNPLFIDRLLAVAHSQSIPCTLIVNKVDQGLNETENLVQIYQDLGVPVLKISAKFGTGLDELSALLQSEDLQIAALVGISGVGKSTLLNKYVPDARSRTQEINERTGLGRQTTTQALAHIYRKKNKERLLFVDMPGLQGFGVSHLSIDQISHSFPEILSRSNMCEFSDCGHIREQICAVRQAVEEGEIAPSRYLSFIKMIEEIEELEEY